jgi:acyl carrier protein
LIMNNIRGEKKMLSAAAEVRSDEVTAVIHDHLKKRYPALANLKPETPLLGSGAIDSLGILELMTFLGERFDIAIEDSDFDRENLENPASLVRFITERKRN